jgi:hypothetical protein
MAVKSKVKSKTSRVKKETTRQRPETKNREAMIKMLVGAGWGNEAIWAALHKEYPETDPESSKYDKEARAKCSRALNSTRALAIKDDNRVMALVGIVGGVGGKSRAKTLDEMEMVNRRRFSWGMEKMDEIYGKTEFVHETDHPDSSYKTEKKTIKTRDDAGNQITKEKVTKTWIKGTWRQGDPMILKPGVEWNQGDPIPDAKNFIPTRDKDGALLSDLDMLRQLIEIGCPEAFISIWGGAPGAGKSKLAVKAAKSVIKTTGEAILYLNGEAEEEDFRMWVGTDVDPDLFVTINAKLLPISVIEAEAERIKPRLIVIDSVQTLAEWNKGTRGQQAVMLILGALKTNPKAGRPHIILISQLNKQNDLKGSRDLEHLADAVAFVTPTEVERVSNFEIPQKNRAAATPNGTMFKHLKNDVELFQDRSVVRVPYQLTVPEESPLGGEIIDPLLPSQVAAEEGDDDGGDEDAGTDDDE